MPLAAFYSTSESDMAVRAAWLYFAGVFSQAEVADKPGQDGLRAHRLISRANREGIDKIYVDGDVFKCLDLHKRLSNAFDSDYGEVIPEFDREALPLRVSGIAGGQYIRLLDGSESESPGNDHGRTAACGEHNMRNRSVRFRCRVDFR